MRIVQGATHLLVLSGFAFVAWLGYRCPTSILTTHFIGSSADACIAIWNMWHFQHALTTGQNPFWTTYLYWPIGSNLILHHYTLFNDVIAYFLLPRFGMELTHNLIYLSSVTLAGYGIFLTLREFDVEPPEAFVAGTAFALSPVMVYSGLGGFDLSNLHAPVFLVWMLCRAARRRRAMDSFGAALCLTWVWCYNYYHFLFCALIAVFFYLYLERPLSIEFIRRAVDRRMGVLRRAVDILATAAFFGVVAALLKGQREMHGSGGFTEVFRYCAPYLFFWALLGLGIALRWKQSVSVDYRALGVQSMRPYLGIFGFWFLLNLPLVVAVVSFMRTGDYGSTPKAWRGGGNPIDVLHLLIPNSYNPVWEHVGLSLPQGLPVGWLLLGTAWWLWRSRVRAFGARLWLASALFSFVFSLGPWLKIFGIHTYLPMPFYFLHLLPVFSNLQTSHRFPVYITLFLCLALGAALQELRSRTSSRVRWVVPIAAIAIILLEFFPPARPMQQFPVPVVVSRLADRPDGALLTLPTGGIFNGLSAVGAIGAPPDIIWQTVHQKPMVGGYLTRVSRRLYELTREDPIYGALVRGQAGSVLEPMLTDARMIRYLQYMRLKYILVDTTRVPQALQNVVLRWPVHLIDEGQGLKLYEVILVKGHPPSS